MYDFRRFGLREMILSSRTLRLLGGDCGSLEGAAAQIVDFFFDTFRDGGTRGLDGSADPNCALVRCFKTHRFAELPPDLREIATGALEGGAPENSMICLTLLASRGVEPEWNTRHGSAGHRAIPLATAAGIKRIPMIARMIEQVGLQPRDVLRANPEMSAMLERQAFDVFHVEEALESPFVPAQQDFVVPYGIRSVLGFGGVLPSGELFFVLLFTRVPVRRETAALFRTVSLSAKLVLLRYTGARVFAA